MQLKQESDTPSPLLYDLLKVRSQVLPTLTSGLHKDVDTERQRPLEVIFVFAHHKAGRRGRTLFTEPSAESSLATFWEQVSEPD